MAYTKEALLAKIHEMYPVIREHGEELELVFDPAKQVWTVTLKKGGHTLDTFLDKKEADDCMEHGRSVYLGLHIEEFFENFEHQEEMLHTA